MSAKSPFATDRAGGRRAAPGQVRRRRGRRGPRERRRPGPCGRESDAGGDQLHGSGGTRPDLPRPDRRAMRGVAAASDGRAEHVAFRNGLHGLHRGARADDDGNLGGRSCGHGADRDRSEDAAFRSSSAGAHVSAARPSRRRAEARGSDRGVGRSGAHRRAESLRRSLRGHERRRLDGARVGSREILREASPRDGDRGRPDPAPDEDRAARPPHRVAARPDPVRRVSRPRLPKRADAGGTPGARPGRDLAKTSRFSFGSTRNA